MSTNTANYKTWHHTVDPVMLMSRVKRGAPLPRSPARFCHGARFGVNVTTQLLFFSFSQNFWRNSLRNAHSLTHCVVILFFAHTRHCNTDTCNLCKGWVCLVKLRKQQFEHAHTAKHPARTDHPDFFWLCSGGVPALKEWGQLFSIFFYFFYFR